MYISLPSLPRTAKECIHDPRRHRAATGGGEQVQRPPLPPCALIALVLRVSGAKSLRQRRIRATVERKFRASRTVKSVWGKPLLRRALAPAFLLFPVAIGSVLHATASINDVGVTIANRDHNVSEALLEAVVEGDAAASVEVTVDGEESTEDAATAPTTLTKPKRCVLVVFA
jgi:hypothetical protein